jgi:hypothetical protein
VPSEFGSRRTNGLLGKAPNVVASPQKTLAPSVAAADISVTRPLPRFSALVAARSRRPGISFTRPPVALQALMACRWRCG